MNRLTLVIALLGLTLSPSLASAQASQARMEKFTMMSGGNVTPTAPIYLLDTLGFAKAEGLDYSVKTVMANVLNLVVAGEGDLGVIGVSTALVPVREGKETSIVYAISSGGGTGFLAASPKVKSITECTRLSTSRAGSAVFSAAMAYKTLTGAKYNILEIGDPNQIIPSVLSGGSDCVVQALALVQTGLDNGLHLLVDPRNPATVPPGTIQDTISTGLWGMKDNLQKKRSAVEKFMRAMKRVEQYIKTTPALEVAAALIKHDDFKTYKPETIARQIEIEKLFWFPDGGYIRSATWPLSLKFFQYGLAFVDPANQLYSWDNRVDMSYWITANGQPARR